MELDLDALQVLPADLEDPSVLCGPTCGTGVTCQGETCTLSN